MPKKKSPIKLIIILSIVGLLVLYGVYAIFLKKNDETPAVTIEKVSKRTIVQTISGVGKIQPEKQVKISSESSGEIIQLNVREGDTVKANQLVAKIQPDIINSQVLQAQATVQSSQMNIATIQAEITRNEADLKRITELYKKQYASKQELDAATASYESSINRKRASEADLQRSISSLSQIRASASRTSIFTPMSGVVTSLKVEQGEKVVGTAQMQGTEMMVVSDLSIMNAWIEISENDIALVSYGDTAEVTIDAFPDKVFKGVVYEIGNSALTSGTGTQDETTNFQVKVRLVDTDFKLKPGMSCSVDIITETKKDIIAVPLRAITVRLGNEFGGRGQRAQGEQGNATKSDDAPKSSPNKKPPTIIFLYENGVVKQKKIKTGISDKGFIEVTDGLNEGQTFVSGSYQMVSKVLQEGMKVTVEKEGAGKKRSGGKPQ
ncbi:MAG: efflux RND transporter periplasmic adaptor subunit [Candidatus Kapabacteria bacterium]|nr:efflux RND transporter periplasmic adaptor subunit [Candidatus Kapabacteria bacterium]